MSLLDFEKIIGKSVKQITLEDVSSIIKNEEAKNFLTSDYNNAIEVSKNIIDGNPDEDVVNQFKPIYYRGLLNSYQSTIGKLFQEEDNDKLFKSFEEYFKNSSSDALSHLSALLIALVSSFPFDGKAEEPTIRKDVDEVISILKDLKFELALDVICDLIDLVDQVRGEYYKKFEVDIFSEENNNFFKDYMAKLDEFMTPLYEAQQKLAEEAMEGKTPEDLGCLDITQLDKEKKGE